MSGTTPQERQRVGKRLRTLGYSHGAVDEWDVEDELGLDHGDLVEGYVGSSLLGLADLIDPTCTFDPLRDDDGYMKLLGAVYPDRCSACGKLYIAGEQYGYCPNCGARILRGESDE